MSKIHDGKLNTDKNYPMDEGVMNAEPMIDEEVELALLEAMNIETPDLWDRIQAGISDNGPKSKDDGGNGSQDSASGDGQENSNVVSFEQRHKRDMRRVWTRMAVAAALIIVMIPVVRVLNKAKNGEDSAKPHKSEAAYEETAVAQDTEASFDYESDGVAMATEAATEAPTEAAAEYFSNDEESDYDDHYDKNTLSGGAKNTSGKLAGEGWEIEGLESTTEAYAGGTTRNDVYLYNNNKATLNIRMKDNIEIQTFLQGVIVKDGEDYYITNYVNCLSSDDTPIEDRILILNPEESGLLDLLNSGDYEDGSTVLIAVKYPAENNRNEVEIVEIITGE